MVLSVVDIDVVDSCPGWEIMLSKLTETGNKSLKPAKVTFHHADIVTEYSKLTELLSTKNLVTLMFTLNELITVHGKVAATKMLLEIIKQIPSKSFILVLTALRVADIDCRLADVFGGGGCWEEVSRLIPCGSVART